MRDALMDVIGVTAEGVGAFQASEHLVGKTGPYQVVQEKHVVQVGRVTNAWHVERATKEVRRTVHAAERQNGDIARFVARCVREQSKSWAMPACTAFLRGVRDGESERLLGRRDGGSVCSFTESFLT